MRPELRRDLRNFGRMLDACGEMPLDPRYADDGGAGVPISLFLSVSMVSFFIGLWWVRIGNEPPVLLEWLFRILR